MEVCGGVHNGYWCGFLLSTHRPVHVPPALCYWDFLTADRSVDQFVQDDLCSYDIIMSFENVASRSFNWNVVLHMGVLFFTAICTCVNERQPFIYVPHSPEPSWKCVLLIG
jgi:hypothetical protein